ncbi:MAG: ribosome assembly RNA-binding protein YhbY [Gammaproteobacteria bacterium HGW-Gammaproteobacteria-8]|nr:MAG: ribosome assembly RNA-binding protein YhbY [Gammaproteobacteria bacterium HGW-Gammaproteobacteria-8]
MQLDNAKLRKLRGLCHDLSPVVMVADKGLTENVWAEIELALDSHELIKLKLRAERDQRRDWIEQITRRSGATLVQQIGQVACLFRPNPKKRRVLA